MWENGFLFTYGYYGVTTHQIGEGRWEDAHQ